jgi:Uma2 family endonuclease
MQSLATRASQKPHRRRWTKKEFYQMAEMGWFEGKRAELIEGEIIEMPAMNVAHATAVRLCLAVLRDVFSKGYIVDSQLPFDLGESSEPQPDIAVIRGGLRDFIHFHPSSAVLIMEISDSTLSLSRTTRR